MKKFLSLLLMLVLCLSLAAPGISYAATIKLTKSKLELNVGDTYTLKLSGASGTVKWSSDKKTVATVSSKGKITAKSTGKATISATYKNKKYKCTVTIVDKVVTVTVTNLLSSDEISEFLGEIDFQDVTVNDDYTTTYVMTKSQQVAILDFLNKYIINELTNLNYEEIPEYYKSITANKDLTEFNALVDKDAYMNGRDSDWALIGLVILSGGYQQFSGVKDEDIKYLIHIIDDSTKEEIDVLDSDSLK